jgi:hypothetical protein
MVAILSQIEAQSRQKCVSNWFYRGAAGGVISVRLAAIGLDSRPFGTDSLR